MAPGCGVGITSIPREQDLKNILIATERALKAGITKPSARMAEAVRDPLWRKVRPHLFFDSLSLVRNQGRHLVNPISSTAAAVAGSSLYCEMIERMHGNLV